MLLGGCDPAGGRALSDTTCILQEGLHNRHVGASGGKVVRVVDVITTTGTHLEQEKYVSIICSSASLKFA